MKTTMIRSFRVARVLIPGLLLAAATAFAVPLEDDGDKRRGPRGGSGPGAGLSVDRMARVLSLTEDQKAEWTRVSEEHQAEVRPLLGQLRQISEQAREEMNRDEPDAAVVGQLEIDRRNLGRQLQGARTAVEERLVTLLDHDQRTRWEALKEAERFDRGRRFRRGRDR